MNSCNPLNSLAQSLYSAIWTDLNDIEYEWRQPGESPLAKKLKKRRPTQHEVEVYMFPQMWGSTALGFGGMGGAAMTTAETVVVRHPYKDACVYFNGRLAYHINHPNARFQEHMSSHTMMPVSGAVKVYET